MNWRWLVLILSLGAAAGAPGAEISLVRVGDEWRYWPGTSAPGGGSGSGSWTQLDFDDHAWPAGRSGFSLGLGGLNEATAFDTLPGAFNSAFMRARFVVADPAELRWLLLRADYQHGFAAYLNGKEVVRRNLAGRTGDPIAFDASAAAPHYHGAPEEIDLSAMRDLLRAGTNILAVEIHSGTEYGRSFSVVPELMANFTRGPFVQNASTNSIQVIWKTWAATDGEVEFGATPGLGQVVMADGSSTNHAVRLSGLAAGATYYYRVRGRAGDNVVESPVSRFTTLKQSGSIQFAVVGDTGEAGPAQLVIADLLGKEKADFILHAGDVIYPAFEADLADLRCFSVYQPIMEQVPFYFAIGNHDLYFGDQAYLDAFYLPTNNVSGTEHYYSFEAGDAHVSVLFAPYLYQYTPTVGDAQYRWLDADLGGTAKPWKLILMHHPMISSALHRNDDQNANGIRDEEEVMNVFLPLARKHGVQVIFAGHDHAYERIVPTNGVQLVVTGGGGSVLYSLSQRDPGSVHFSPQYNFLRVALDHDALRMEAIGLDGAVFDRMYLQRQLPTNQIYSAAWHSPAWPDRAADDGDGNVAGQVFDFAGGGFPTLPGEFSNLGMARVNNDSQNVYIGLEEAMLYPGHDIFLFAGRGDGGGVSRMAGLGNGVVDPFGEGVDGLDFLDNLSFTNFTPWVGCILGDEFADENRRQFVRTNLALNAGQGVYFLQPGFPDVAGSKLQQFNRSPQIGTDLAEQNADFIEVAIPLTALGVQPGDVIQLGAVVGGLGFDTNKTAQSRELDRSFLGRSFSGSGLGPAVLEGVKVRLAMPPLLIGLERVSNGRAQIRLQTMPGQKYQLQSAPAVNGVFSDVLNAGFPMTVRGTNVVFEVPAGGGREFFRVRVVE